MPFTISQVNRAGRTLRDFHLDPARSIYGPPELAAFAVLEEFRAAHGEALARATDELRSVVAEGGSTAEVSQRLKRATTMVDKLARQPTMALSRMQDIAGCRAVMANLDELRRIGRRLASLRKPLRTYDYVTNPAPSGYRSIHLILDYDGKMVEVQLRTAVMHQWAIAVETLGNSINTELKSGSGPPAVLDWLETVSRALAIEERGHLVDTELTTAIERLGRAAAAELERES